LGLACRAENQLPLHDDFSAGLSGQALEGNLSALEIFAPLPSIFGNLRIIPEFS